MPLNNCPKCKKPIQKSWQQPLCYDCHFARVRGVQERNELMIGDGPYRCTAWYTVEIGMAENKIEASGKFTKKHKGYPIIRSRIIFDEETSSWWCNYLLDSSD